MLSPLAGGVSRSTPPQGAEDVAEGRCDAPGARGEELGDARRLLRRTLLAVHELAASDEAGLFGALAGEIEGGGSGALGVQRALEFVGAGGRRRQCLLQVVEA